MSSYGVVKVKFKTPHKDKMPWFTWRQKLGNPECIYAERWILKLPFNLGSIRFHHFLKSDDARAHHDHPWWFVTFVLRGSYVDESTCDNCDGQGRVALNKSRWGDLPDEIKTEACRICHGDGKCFDYLTPGSVRFRPALHRHTVRTSGVWTIIVTGPWQRRWGFWEKMKDGHFKFRNSKRWFIRNGHHPCDQP